MESRPKPHHAALFDDVFHRADGPFVLVSEALPVQPIDGRFAVGRVGGGGGGVGGGVLSFDAGRLLRKLLRDFDELEGA